jgi:integrase
MKSKLNIDQAVKLIRENNPPKVPAGKSELFIHDPAQTGFGIRVTPKGAATWSLRPSIHGRQSRKAIGDVLLMNRKIALQEARNILYKMEHEKLDPQKARRDALESAKRTFKVVAAEFLDRKRKERTRSGTLRTYERYLTAYYLEPLHDRPFDEISPREFDERFKVIEAESGNETAHACHSLVKYIYDWAVDVDLFPEDQRNPLSKVQAPVKNRPRERVLTHDEIRIIWKACDDWEAETLAFAEKGERKAPGGFTLLTDYPRAVQLLLLTGMRAQEVGDLHWEEIQLDNAEIRLGPHRTKSKRELCIPLSDMAVEILRKAELNRRPGDPCVFGRGDGRPIVLDGIPWKEGLYLGDTEAKITKRLKRGDTGFWKHEIDPKKRKRILYALIVKEISINQIMREEQVSYRTIKAIEAQHKAGPVETKHAVVIDHWTIHDLRRTFRTGMSEIGVDFEIAERLVGHLTPITRNKTAGTYDRYEYWREKQAAVDKWQNQIRAILDGNAQEVPRSKFNNQTAA